MNHTIEHIEELGNTYLVRVNYANNGWEIEFEIQDTTAILTLMTDSDSEDERGITQYAIGIIIEYSILNNLGINRITNIEDEIIYETE